MEKLLLSFGVQAAPTRRWPSLRAATRAGVDGICVPHVLPRIIAINLLHTMHVVPGAQ